jgi:hypothetical protein
MDSDPEIYKRAEPLGDLDDTVPRARTDDDLPTRKAGHTTNRGSDLTQITLHPNPSNNPGLDNKNLHTAPRLTTSVSSQTPVTTADARPASTTAVPPTVLTTTDSGLKKLEAPPPRVSSLEARLRLADDAANAPEPQQATGSPPATPGADRALNPTTEAPRETS